MCDGIAARRAAAQNGHLAGGGDAPISSGFHMSLFTSTLNVGAMVEPLTSQMAEYLGVPGGLMVKQVARKSEAAAAGLKAFDVILKVGSDSINTSADWDRALRSNQGKPVQVTILRDKKQQTLTLQVDSKHRSAVDRSSNSGQWLRGLEPIAHPASVGRECILSLSPFGCVAKIAIPGSTPRLRPHH